MMKEPKGRVYLSYAGNDGWVLAWTEDGQPMRIPGFKSEAEARAYAKKVGVRV